MPFPITRALAETVAGVDPAALSATVAERAVIAITDTVGVMFAGRGEPAVATLGRMLAASGTALETPQARALVFGTAAHALDYDDVAFGGHVSAVIVPAILALLPQGPVAGRRVLAAYAMGLEAWAEVATRERSVYHSRGAHPTGLLGPIAAAAAASVLLDLDATTTQNAIAIAASLGAGLTVSFGTMTKPFHAGRAAEAGVTAALLAQSGFTSAPDALEAPNGFLAVHSPAGEIDLERPLLSADEPLRLDLMAPGVKRYPVCYAAHRAVDAALELHPGLDPAQITGIEVLISPRHSDNLRYSAPQTVAEARFSLEFAVATALVTGGLGLRDLSPEGLMRADVRARMRRVSRRMSVYADPVLPGWAAYDRVTLTLADGRRLESSSITRPLGHADRPMTADAARGKALDCLSWAEVSGAGELLAAIDALSGKRPSGLEISVGQVLGLIGTVGGSLSRANSRDESV